MSCGINRMVGVCVLNWRMWVGVCRGVRRVCRTHDAGDLFVIVRVFCFVNF